MKISDHYVATHTAGSYGYRCGRPRGHIAVWDGSLYLYRIDGRKPREVRDAILYAWPDGSRLRGRFPEYTIKRV